LIRGHFLLENNFFIKNLTILK